MKAVSSRITKSLPVGAVINCADNSGVKKFQIISVRGYKGKHRTKPTGGVASLVTCRVYKGEEKVRHEVHRAVIIRQVREYRRPNGMRISFEDNAAVMVDDKLQPKGTMIKGPVAREVVERYPAIGKLARTIV